ncbi:uncharacterized protein LOC112467292 [Temnothorax curvispinosus]|uniref:Uncharacterized protein LOC112467292 n=1 Tax=Temnothorax curvispinosus TaxID=300111 RepID=A0A6J1RFN6_9HYME|nr:uncharacterized protein LOC112467292 [Temnothorax curvispinosus]
MKAKQKAKTPTKIPMSAVKKTAMENTAARIINEKKRMAEDGQDCVEVDTQEFSQEEGDWHLVEPKKMAKDKRAKTQEQTTVKTGNKEDDQSGNDDVNSEEMIHESGNVTTEDPRYETASEIEIEPLDSVVMQHANTSCKVELNSSVKDKRNTSMSDSSRSTNRTARKIFENRAGVLERINELDASELANQKQGINKLTKETGISAEIDQRGSKFVGVILDWGDSIPELWKSMDDHDDVIRIARMYRKKWDKEKKILTEEDTGNLIITFTGDKVRKNMDMFGRRTAIKIRPFIASVKQCFKCFRFGHIKALCKSKERCIICGELAHGNCTRETKCRNCGGNHRSTWRKCIEYEKNKNINLAMGVNNVSRMEAERILAGKEQDKIQEQTYNRYEAPAQWPKLTQPRQKMEGRWEHPHTSRRVITYEEDRKKTSLYKDKLITQKKQDNYYKQFDNRSEEITKDRRGIALKKAERQSESWDKETSKEESENIGWSNDDDVITNLATKLKNLKFRRTILEMI